jgi:hypothetical protein
MYQNGAIQQIAQNFDQSKIYGGNIKQKVYENNWSENNLDQLRLKISSVIRNLGPELVHGENVKNRLYQLVRDHKM